MLSYDELQEYHVACSTRQTLIESQYPFQVYDDTHHNNRIVVQKPSLEETFLSEYVRRNNFSSVLWKVVRLGRHGGLLAKQGEYL